MTAPLRAAAIGVILLGACATAPLGPTVQVMPPPNKPFDVFQADDAACRQYAVGLVQPAVDQANQQQAAAIIIGAALGAALGAAAGGGNGAGLGAAAGSIVGTGAGADNTAWAQMTIQQRYDIAYAQCMYSRGAQVPGFTALRYNLPPPPPPRHP